MSDDQKQQAIKEKELGNQAYKQRQFEEALTHYDKAWELDNTNITFLTNKAGKERSPWLTEHYGMLTLLAFSPL